MNGEHREAINSLTSAPIRFGCQMSYEKALGFRSSLGFGSDDRGPAVAQHTGIFHRRPGNCLASAPVHPTAAPETRPPSPRGHSKDTHHRSHGQNRPNTHTDTDGNACESNHTGRAQSPAVAGAQLRGQSPALCIPGARDAWAGRPPALPPAQAAPGRGGRDRSEGQGRAGLGSQWLPILSGPWRGKEKARQVGTELAPPLGAGALGAWPDLPLDV